MPEIVFMELDSELARTEPDPEIQDLIRASAGLNLALDYLAGSVTFDPVVDTPDADLASSIVWFDGLATNVDRTSRNTNMLIWHERLWLIDHGACLYFHHSWTNYLERSRDPFPAIKDHVLLPFADRLAEAAVRLSSHLTPEVIDGVLGLIPDAWMIGEPPDPGNDDHRHAYRQYLLRRLEPPYPFVEEANRARSVSV